MTDKPSLTLGDLIKAGSKRKNFDEHLTDLKDAIKTVVEQTVPSQKLSFRRETALMVFEMLEQLAACGLGKHEPMGVLEFETELGEPILPGVSVCTRCRCLYWDRDRG